MRIADHPKKLGLLLLPLIPLSVVGVVDVVGRFSAGTTEVSACTPAPIREAMPAPVIREDVSDRTAPPA